MDYVVIYEKGTSSYGAYVPDLPGCIAVSSTLEEVQTLIQEAIEFHIEGLQEDGDDVPQPSLNIPVEYDIPHLGIHKVVENYIYITTILPSFHVKTLLVIFILLPWVKTIKIKYGFLLESLMNVLILSVLAA